MLISTHKLYFSNDKAIYDVIKCKNQFENDITTDMKSAGIHLQNFQSFEIVNHFHFY